MKITTLLWAGALTLLPAATTASAQITPCWGDITLDHQVNVNDLLAVITSWGPCVGAPPGSQNSGGVIGEGDPGPPPPVYCAADIAPLGAPNGIVNVDDLLVVITTWGACATPPPNNGQGYVVWCEDWSNGNYNRWTDDASDSDPCTFSEFSSEHFTSPSLAHKSWVTCVGGIGGVHRGYPGLRFLGDAVLPSIFMNSTGGIDSPNGLVIQWRGYLRVPYVFNSQDHDLWMSMMTATDDCSNAWHRVITLNIDDPTMRLRPQHVDGVQYAYAAPAFPRDQWNRVTVYLNLYTGVMHVWQNGTKVATAWFTRPSHQTCQYHFGLYCSGMNYDVAYFEDDMRIIKLTQPLLDFVGEPTFPRMMSGCAQPGG